MTSGDLTFDLISKMTKWFRNDFGTLSNAGYRVSLRGPGAEIEGGSQEPLPPSGGGISRGPSGRGLTV